MPTYLRKWKNRTILVRPTKWDASEEIPPWDCLDFTSAFREISGAGLYLDMNVSVAFYLYRIQIPIMKELKQNPHLYRSKPFCRTHKDNPRMDEPLFGSCVVATEAMLFLAQYYQLMMGDNYSGYSKNDYSVEPWKVKDLEGIYHWYIMYNDHDDDLFDGDQIDVTEGQFHNYENLRPKYSDGKKTSLMGWKQSPSKRTLDLIGNCLTKSVRYTSLDNSYEHYNTGTLEGFFPDD
jgi:hypothetical protein